MPWLQNGEAQLESGAMPPEIEAVEMEIGATTGLIYQIESPYQTLKTVFGSNLRIDYSRNTLDIRIRRIWIRIRPNYPDP